MQPIKCKVQKLCGGCLGPGVVPAKLAKQKRDEVQAIMDGFQLHVKVGDVHLAENNLGYRNKVIVGFAKDKDKKIYSGLYAPHSHRVVNSSGCPMHPPLVNEIIDFITDMVGSMKFELYNPRTGTGLLRHVLIRYAKTTGQVMVVFVTSSKQFPSRRNIVHALTEKFPQITTIIQNVNARDTSVVLENDCIVLYGKGYITDELLGLKISFAPESFYQIHSEQCAELYKLGRQMLDLKPTDTVLDTYCGVGTIGLYMADAVKQVTGVELNKEAVKNAIFNAKQNHIRNIRFVAMDSTRFMFEALKHHQNYNAIILDPPRAGTTPSFIQNACALHPDKILYISCDPKTQARDLNIFRRYGYVTQNIELVDMFPQTAHIESLCVLTYSPKTKNGQKVKADTAHTPRDGRKPYNRKGTHTSGKPHAKRPPMKGHRTSGRSR